jgi:outer membrane protein assembly factor BamB
VTLPCAAMSSDAPKGRRRRILLALAVLVLLVAGSAAAFFATRPGDVSNPDVEFRAEPTPTPVPAEPDTSDPAQKVDRFVWPMYGFTKDRRRFLPLKTQLRPPFKQLWKHVSSALLEFPPVMERNSLYVLNDDGVLYAISKRTGRTRWRKKLGSLAAASPAISHGRLFVTLLSKRDKAAPGRAVALAASTGKIIWSRDVPSRSESSPLLDGGTVYYGSENGTVYAIKASNGEPRWTFRASGAVKGGLALSEGKLYFGDYAGKAYAIRQSNGSLVWRASTKGARFGFASGRFYSTPAVAYGRVYMGNVDGNVYSFSADSGRLAWRHKTSGYVYSSPAVGQAPGDRPTVYAGSYDGHFYALDARSGAQRWVRSIGGKISGGATLLGDTVYFSDLANRRTFGLGARTGRTVFKFDRGGYNPVVSDGRTIFLVGYATLHALRPMTAKEERKVRTRKRDARRARAAALRAAAGRDQRLQSRCRTRAERLHDRHGAVVRSFRRCVDRRRRAATRRACTRRAQAVHHKRGKIRRSVRRCIARHR